jgi:signal transduction histidine kinase
MSIFTSSEIISLQRSKVTSEISTNKVKAVTDSLKNMDSFYIFDSLLARKDTLKYFHLYCWGRDLAELKPNLSFAIADSILEQSKRDGYTRGIISGYNLLGVLYTYQDDYVMAVTNLKEAIKIGQRNKDNTSQDIKDKYGCSLYYLGDLYFKRKDYKIALDYYKKSMAVFDSYSETELLEEDLNFTLTAIAFTTIREDRAYAIYSVGKTFIKLGNLDKARIYLDKAFEIAKKTSFVRLQSRIYYSQSELELALNDTTSAIERINKSLELLGTVNLNEFRIYNYLKLMEIYLAQGNYKEIESIYSLLLKLTVDMNMQKEKVKTHQMFSEYLFVIGKPKEAYKELEIANKISERLVDENQSRRFGQIEAGIKYQKQLFDLELESIKSKEEEKRLTTQLYFTIVITLLLIMVAIIIFNYARKNKILNNQLTKVNDDLEIANTQLTVLNETKIKLFRIISHDLSNPIKEFDARVTQLKEDISKDDNQNIIFKVNALGESASSIYNLLNSLLNWAESQFKEIRIEKANVNIDEAIRRVLLLNKSNIEHKQLIIEKDLELTNLNTDPNIFQIIIRNIIQNSIKFTPTGGSIRISTYEEDGFNILSIADTGQGMSKEQIDAILTNNYYNINFDDIQTGNGLGLRAVKDYIDRLDCKLFIESSVDNGTKVIIYFS